MKTVLINFFSSTEHESLSQTFKASVFLRNGYPLFRVISLAFGDEKGFYEAVEDVKNNGYHLVIADNQKSGINIRNILSEVYKKEISENQTAKTFISAIEKADGGRDNGEYATFLSGALLIPNVNDVMQGFYYKADNGSVALLPDNDKQFRIMSEGYLFGFYDEAQNKTTRKETIKYFGNKNALYKTLESAKANTESRFNYFVKEQDGDFTVTLLFNDFSGRESGKIVSFIISELREDIYAETDQTLSERLFDILKVKNLNFSTAESFTGGRIAQEMVKNAGASAVFKEGIVCYSNQSKINRLGVKMDDLVREGAVSSIVAYQMAVGLLREGADVAVATTGIAGPKSDDTNKPVGLCYIAVGTKDGVHTYKYNLSGTREQITERAKNTATFLAIKRLKKI